MKLISKIVMLATVCVASLTLSSCNKDGGSSEPAIYGKWQGVKYEHVNEDGTVDIKYATDDELTIYEFGMNGSVHIYDEYDQYDIYGKDFLYHSSVVQEGTFLLNGDDLTMTFTHLTWTRTYEDGRVETEEEDAPNGEGTVTLNLCKLTSNEMVLYQEIGRESAYGYYERIN